MLFLLLALTGTVFSLWQAVMLRPLVVELYGAPVWPGWGVVVCTIGLLLLLFVGLRGLLRS
jgi:hypothetical protein